MSLDTRPPLESPQQTLSVGLTEPGDLYQLVHVCVVAILINNYNYSEWYTVVDCGSPPIIVSGSPGTPSGTTYQATVLYTCDSGYEVSAGVTVATATCMANGNWGPLPTCQRMYQIPLLLHTPNLQRYMINGYRCLMW